MIREVQGLSRGHTARNWVEGGRGIKGCVSLEPVCLGCSTCSSMAAVGRAHYPWVGPESLVTDLGKHHAPGMTTDRALRSLALLPVVLSAEAS